MSDPNVPDEEVSASTSAAEADDEQVHAGADRPPTEEEEAVADAQPPLDPSVAEHYQEQAEKGAAVEGEGSIS